MSSPKEVQEVVTVKTPEPKQLDAKEHVLVEYRLAKLMRAGFTQEIASEIANLLVFHDSDHAIKALSMVKASGLDGFEAEYTTMYILGLRELPLAEYVA